MHLQSILLIEDEPDDRDLILIAFKKQNIDNKIIVADSAAMALDMLLGQGKYENQQISPIFILIDIKMPLINGTEFLRMIKSHDRIKNIPIIVFTSSIEENDLLQSYDYGANSFIHKPIDFIELTNVIGKITDYWLRINQAP